MEPKNKICVFQAKAYVGHRFDQYYVVMSGIN